MTNPKNELLPGTLEMMVLRTLSAGPLHGYAVSGRIRERSKEALRIEEGSLYPALHRMEKRGWIEAEWGLSDSNRRAKYYALTRQGKRALSDQRAKWARLTGAIDAVMGPDAPGAAGPDASMLARG